MAKGRKIRGVFWRDGEWWIRWACTLGHDHRKPSGESKTAATEEHKAKRAEVREARKAGHQRCPKLSRRREGPPLFEDISKDYMVYSERSKRSYADDKTKEKHFLSLFKGRMVSDISPKEIEDFKAEFLDGRSPATVNAYLRFLKAVFNRAIRQGRLQFNPVTAVKLYHENNARNRCLSLEEEGRLFDALPSPLRPLVMLALHTGMRRDELRNLRWQEVDFQTGTLRITRDKAGDGRWVTLNSAALEAVLTVKREQQVMSPYVFCSPRGRFLHNLDRLWRPAVQEGQVPDFRFHDLRHTFASRLAMAGVDLYTVQRAGGWKTQVMVQRYAHLSPDHIRAAVERLARPGSRGATGTKTGTGG